MRAGFIDRLDRGLYVAHNDDVGPIADAERFAARSVAAILSVSPAWGSHRSAAVLADLPLWTVPDRACITVPPRYTGDARHSHLHRARIPLVDQLPGEVPRLRAARTIIDVAREAGVEEAAVIGDAALRRGLTDYDRILAAAERCRLWPGFRHARQLLPLLDARAESPIETISRVRLTRYLPAPEPQTEILDLSGRRIGYVDLYWDEFGVVGEIDGKDKYRADPFGTWWKEKKRHELLRECGLPVVRWGRSELDGMAHLVWRIEQAFAEGARRTGPRRWIAISTDRFAPRITA